MKSERKKKFGSSTKLMWREERGGNSLPNVKWRWKKLLSHSKIVLFLFWSNESFDNHLHFVINECLYNVSTQLTNEQEILIYFLK